MKLSTFAAIAVVIGGSFLIPVPAEARNGWVYSHRAQNGDSVYFRNQGCWKGICNVEKMHSSWSGTITNKVNCNTWKITYGDGVTSDIFPGSNAEWEAKQICR